MTDPPVVQEYARMRCNDKAVFISSRFEEFGGLRRALRERIALCARLQLVAIDLNDRVAAPRPPLPECMAHLRRARFMILLLGESYGACAPGHSKSIVHLEHDAAISEDSEIRVLAFGIGRSYADGRIAYSSDTQFAALQRQVEENHTVGYFDSAEPAAEVAAKIVNNLLTAFHDLFAERYEDEQDVDPGDATADDVVENSEVSSLEALHGRARDTAAPPQLTTALSLAQPARLAALEQCAEANDAIAIGALGLAMRHLRNALRHRPLDIEANYRLARLYIASRQRKRYHEAMFQLDIVRRVCEREGRYFRVSHCLQLQAKASMAMGDAATALSLAEQACEVTPGYGRAHYEWAVILAATGRRADARKELLEGIRSYFPLWHDARREPAFRPIISLVEKALRQWLGRHRSVVDRVRATEYAVARIAAGDAAEVPQLPSLPSLSNPLRLSRFSADSIRRQHAWLCKLYRAVVDAARQCDGSVAGSRAGALVAERAALNRDRAATAAEIQTQNGALLGRRVKFGMLLALLAVMSIAMVAITSSAAKQIWPVVAVVLAIVAYTVVRATRGLSTKSIEPLHAVLDAQDAALRRVTEAEEALRRDELQARAVFARAFAAWLPSLRITGKHQPYSAPVGAVGEYVLASEATMRVADAQNGRQIVVEQPLAADLVRTGPTDLRLCRIKAVRDGTVLLSEHAAHGGG